MACNGHNHPPDCQCGFKGGRLASDRVPRWGRWSPTVARRRASGPNASCPHCYARVFFVAPRNGGGAYFEQFGPPWTKHPCTDASKKYSPFNAEGRPKLRNRRSEFERDGWLPLFVRNIELLAIGALIHAVTLEDPTVLHFGLATELEIDSDRPIYFRRLDAPPALAEFNFFPKSALEPVTRRVFVPCLTEIELRIRLNK